MADVAGVELRDIASGKTSRVVALASGGYDILNRGGEIKGGKRPCRAIVVPSGGTLQILGLDGVQVNLPDPASAWEWPIQAQSIVGGTATDVVVIY